VLGEREEQMGKSSEEMGRGAWAGARCEAPLWG